MIMWHGDDTDHKPVLFHRRFFSLLLLCCCCTRAKWWWWCYCWWSPSSSLAPCRIVWFIVCAHSPCRFKWCMLLGANWDSNKIERIVSVLVRHLNDLILRKSIDVMQTTTTDWLFAFPYFLAWQISSLTMTLAPLFLLTNASLSVVVHLHLLVFCFFQLVCVIAACYPAFLCSARQEAADANGASTIRRRYSVAVARKLPKHLHTARER